MQKYSRRKLAHAFVALLDRYPRTDVVNKFATVLITQKMTRDLELFVSDIAHELLKRHRHLAATVTSARKLSTTTITTIRGLLQEVTRATTVSLAHHINPDLKGGFIVRTPVGELDASIQGKLNHLKTLR